MTLNIYMGYFGDDPGEGACLVFAHTAREAKKISWDVVRWWGCEKFTDVRAVRIWKKDHLYKQANQELLAADKPHVIETPDTCNTCGMWGDEIGSDKLCSDCRRDAELLALELQHDKEAREYIATRPLPETHPDDALMSLPYDIR